MKKKYWKFLDIFLLLFFPIIAVVISLTIKAGLFISTLLFYGLPAGYLCLRNQHAIKRAFIFAVLLTPLFLVGDYFAAMDQTWIIATVFPFRFFGLVSLEGVIWGFLFVFSIVIFYEHFLDKGNHRFATKKLRYVGYFVVISVTTFLLGFFLFGYKLNFPFVYLNTGLMFGVIPVLLFFSHFPRFLGKYLKVGLYFSLVAVLHEFTGLELKQWTFPGKNYIGWVDLLGYKFPLEEFIFFFFLSAVTVLCYFEYFDDEHLKKEAKRYS